MKKLLLIICFSFFFNNLLKAQWVKVFQDSVTYDWLSDVKFLNKDTGFVCGISYTYPYPGIILKTTDAGATWDSSQLPDYGWMMSLSIVNDTIIYTGGQDGNRFKTINGGQSWFYDGGFGTRDLSTLYFLNQDTGFAITFNPVIWKTLDHVNWNSGGQYLPGSSSFPNTSSMQFINDSLGYAAFQNVYKTSDTGNTWQRLNVDSNLKASCIYMKNQADGIVIDLKGWVTLTSDGGNTWSMPQLIGPYPLYDVAFVNSNRGYIIGGNDNYSNWSKPEIGVIYITNDGGQSWNLMQTFDHSIISLNFLNDSIGYAVGEKGLILKINNANTVGINPIAKADQLFIFPNPASDKITISNYPFSNKEARVEIYNMMGEKVFSQIIPPRAGQKCEIDVSSFAAGVYLVQVGDVADSPGRGDEEKMWRGKMVKE